MSMNDYRFSPVGNLNRERECLVPLSSLGKGSVSQSLRNVQAKLKNTAQILISGNSRSSPSLAPLLRSSYKGPKQSGLQDSLKSIELSMSRIRKNLDTAAGYLGELSTEAAKIDEQIEAARYEWNRNVNNRFRQVEIARTAAELHEKYARRLRDTESLLKGLKILNVKRAGEEVKGTKGLKFPNYLKSTNAQLLHEYNMDLLDAAIASEKDPKKSKSLKYLRVLVEKHQALLPPLYLLKFDPKDDGKIVVSKGNPYTAKNTQIFIPGINSKVSGVEDNLSRTILVHNAMAGEGNPTPESNASVFFLDWDPPDSDASGGALLAPQIPSTAFEKTFVPFVRLIEQENPTSRTTVAAHSFGTYAVAWAISRNKLPIDGLALMGSPGVPVEHATDLTKTMNDGAKVYSYTTKRDFVAITNPYEIATPIVMAIVGPITGYATDRLLDTGDPKSPGFGAIVMPTWGTGHSGYWTRLTDLEGMNTLVRLAKMGVGTLSAGGGGGGVGSW